MSVWMHITSNVCAVANGSVHAADALRAIKEKRYAHVAACGQPVTLLAFPIQDRPESTITVAWPPYVADARQWGYKRCRDCMAAAPGRPSHPPFVDAP